MKQHTKDTLKEQVCMFHLLENTPHSLSTLLFSTQSLQTQYTNLN